MILDKIMPVVLANHLWQSTVFALVAALLGFALQNNRAETRYWIWLAASLKFLIPYSLLASVGGYIHWSSAPPLVHSTFSTAVRQIDEPFTLPALLASEPHTHGSMIPAIVFAIWLCGFVTVLLWWTRSWLRIRRAIRRATPVEMQAPIRILCSDSSLEPGVFGIFRPVLLLPKGISDHLEPAHLQAILAHELCHVRRRDNLAAAVHMLVEAVFWFHPLVWWIGARLVEERERACDEEVVRLGNQPQIYAESILKTCQFCVESPLVCMSGVTGADLKKRIVHIMSQGFAGRLTLRNKLLLAAAGIAALGLPIAAGLLNSAQQGNTEPPNPSANRLTFEVASIKPSKSTGGINNLRDPMLATWTNIPLAVVIQSAYRLQPDQLLGGPSWVYADRWNIIAKNSLPATREQQAAMLQPLLADRFRLEVHWETRQRPEYELVVDKGGPKLHGGPGIGVSQTSRPGTRIARGLIDGHGITAAEFAFWLRGELGRPVIDSTGLSGKYDFKVQWVPDESQPNNGEGEASPPDATGPSIFAAIQDLGLKLKPIKGPVKILVIDHVEKPSEN